MTKLSQIPMFTPKFKGKMITLEDCKQLKIPIIKQLTVKIN